MKLPKRKLMVKKLCNTVEQLIYKRVNDHYLNNSKNELQIDYIFLHIFFGFFDFIKISESFETWYIPTKLEQSVYSKFPSIFLQIMLIKFLV